jgi:CHAD domain-containing protein
VRATLAVWADLRVPQVVAGLPEVRLRNGDREAIDDVLYDAADLRLLRSGVQLRRTVAGAWHAWVEPSPWWHRDCGTDVVLHSEPVVGERPPDVLVGLLRGSPLAPAVTVRVRRRTWTATGTRPHPNPRPEAAPDGPFADASSQVEERPSPTTEANSRLDAARIGPSADAGSDTEANSRLDAARIGPSADAGSEGDGEAQPVATVVLEDLALLTGRRVGARRALVHVDGHPPLAQQLIARFEAAGAELLDDEAPPVLDLLGGRVRRSVVPGGPSGALPHDATAGQVVSLATARAVARLLANDVAIRLDLGPEGVHQARVSTRRLRSDLKTFAGLLDPGWVASTRDELRWLAAALGEVRDADVLGERLGERIAALDPQDQATAAWLLDEVTAQRATAGDALERVMASDRYLALLDGLVAAANHPPLTGDAGAEAAETFDDLARHAWKPLRKAVRKVTAADDPAAVPVEEVHAVRIRAKRFRYAADAAAPVERAAARHAAALATLQDELGELNDAATAEAWLRDRLPAATAERAFVLGQLVAAERAEIAHRRSTWLGTWRIVDRRKRRAWLTS